MCGVFRACFPKRFSCMRYRSAASGGGGPVKGVGRLLIATLFEGLSGGAARLAGRAIGSIYRACAMRFAGGGLRTAPSVFIRLTGGGGFEAAGARAFRVSHATNGSSCGAAGATEAPAAKRGSGRVSGAERDSAIRGAIAGGTDFATVHQRSSSAEVAKRKSRPG